MSPEQQLEVLKRGVVDLHVEQELLRLLKTGRPLKVKAGFDPTRPDLHLGHTVLMRKMRDFQNLGHEVIFVVGDFTAQIGDPSGRSATRPALTRDEITAAAQTYADQAFKVLDNEQTRVVFNTEWLGALGFDEVIRLAGRYTLARMMERDDFKKRWAEHESISIHELLYPLVQAYDSVHLKCDVELGGTDQLFNLMVGREIMREYGIAPQIVMTMPILEGLNARMENGRLVGDKMSKSLGNYVAVNEPAKEQFAKIMSISDSLMWRYYALLSDLPTTEIEQLEQNAKSGRVNPKDPKMALGVEIVSRFHDAADAEEAKDAWQRQFSSRETPDEMTEAAFDGETLLVQALANAGVVPSTSEARRRIQHGAVRIDGERVSDVQHRLLPRAEPYQIKAGKRDWLRVRVR